MMPDPAPSLVKSKNSPLFTDSTDIEATTCSTLSARSAMDGSSPDSLTLPINSLTSGGACTITGGTGIGVGGTSVGGGVGVLAGAGEGKPQAVAGRTRETRRMNSGYNVSGLCFRFTRRHNPESNTCKPRPQ